MITTQGRTYDDLMAVPSDGALHELVRGEILCMPPPKGEHGAVEAAIVEAIGRYLYQRALTLGWEPAHGRTAREGLVGHLASGEAGMRFTLPDDPDQVRGADVLYLTPEQFARLAPVLRDDYVPEAPALVIEIISPSESATYSNEKVTDYLRAGARQVWQVFLKTRTVHIHHADGTGFTVPTGGTLEGGEVLPGFSAGLAELFG